MRNISVLFICPRFGTIHRGAELVVEAVATRLLPYSITPTVLSCRHQGEFPGVESLFAPLIKRELTEKLDSYPFVRKIFSRFGLRAGAELESASLYFSAKRVLRNRSFDVIVPTGGSWTSKLAKQCFPGAKIIHWGHAGFVADEMAFSDAFVAITEIDATFASARTNKPVFCVPNGVDVAAFTLQTVPPAIPTILCCAALSEFKRQDLLLDAAGLLDPSVRIILAGEGPAEAALRRHRTCQTHRVEFVSRSLHEMPELYKWATVFSLPSPQETFGIVFLEALSTGLNVVAHDAPAQRYVLGDRGRYVDVHDAKAYARTLESAMNNPDPQANRARAELFSWDKTAEKFVAIVRQLTDAS